MTISTQETADNSHLFVGISFFRTLPKKGDFYSYRFYRVLKRLPEPPILLNYMQKYLLVCLPVRFLCRKVILFSFLFFEYFLCFPLFSA